MNDELAKFVRVSTYTGYTSLSSLSFRTSSAVRVRTRCPIGEKSAVLEFLGVLL